MNLFEYNVLFACLFYWFMLIIIIWPYCYSGLFKCDNVQLFEFYILLISWTCLNMTCSMHFFFRIFHGMWWCIYITYWPYDEEISVIFIYYMIMYWHHLLASWRCIFRHFYIFILRDDAISITCDLNDDEKFRHMHCWRWWIPSLFFYCWPFN